MNKVELLERLRQLFSEGEIRDICFELDIDYESLSGSGKGGKSRELINYLSRRERLNDLITICQRERPNISWLVDNSSNDIQEQSSQFEESLTKILFLSAEPTDLARLRLGEEFREVQERLQLARLRNQFQLYQRFSTRVEDITQALLDVQPQIVHFSGHGTMKGAIFVEDKNGSTHPISSKALVELFKIFNKNVKCVILNACYSEIQAKAISNHIKFVIGMKSSIIDSAAIAFTVGFYQALGAGLSYESAFELGCVQISLRNIPNHLIPVLIQR